MGGLATATSTLPAPRACTPGCRGGAAINYPGSYSRGVGEAARTRTPAPGQVQSGPHRQLTGPRGIARPRGNAMALSMLMGVAMATPDQMMGTPAKAIDAGAGGWRGGKSSHSPMVITSPWADRATSVCPPRSPTATHWDLSQRGCATFRARPWSLPAAAHCLSCS